MVEASYEFEHDWKGPETLRRQEYWAMLSGASGQLSETSTHGSSSPAGSVISTPEGWPS